MFLAEQMQRVEGGQRGERPKEGGGPPRGEHKGGKGGMGGGMGGMGGGRGGGG
ncbi:hypothetical protein D3C86_2254230 [compost metagenome]